MIPQVTDDGDHLAGTDSPWLEVTEDALYQAGGSDPPENNNSSGGSSDSGDGMDLGDSFADSGSGDGGNSYIDDSMNAGPSPAPDTDLSTDDDSTVDTGSWFEGVDESTWNPETNTVDVTPEDDTTGETTPDELGEWVDNAQESDGQADTDQTDQSSGQNGGSAQQPSNWIRSAMASIEQRMAAMGDGSGGGMDQQTLAIGAAVVAGGYLVTRGG